MSEDPRPGRDEFLVTKEMVMTQKINMALLEKAG